MKNDTSESAITNLDLNNEITISREQFFDFIKNKKDTENNISRPTQHYLDYFDQYQKTGKKNGWNWAGIWGYFWLFYRRMHLNGLILIVLNIFFSIFSLKYIETCFFVNGALVAPLSSLTDSLLLCLGVLLTCVSLIVIPIVFPMMYGDYLYLKYTNNQISKGILKSCANPWILLLSLLVAIYLPYYLRIIFIDNLNIIGEEFKESFRYHRSVKSSENE